jgi:hypothetical protein
MCYRAVQSHTRPILRLWQLLVSIWHLALAWVDRQELFWLAGHELARRFCLGLRGRRFFRMLEEGVARLVNLVSHACAC